MAGDIYINNLLTDLKTAETEGVELQKEFDWILTLPPSAFASKEMLEWLRKDMIMQGADEGDTDSEFGLELTCQDPSTRTNTGVNTSVLLPDQVHPSHSSPETRSGTHFYFCSYSQDMFQVQLHRLHLIRYFI